MKKINLSKFKITQKGLYWALIITFSLLYLCVGFVSTLHSITFFHLANSLGLAILLGVTYELGQASVLFSILLTKNKDNYLPWGLMFLLTALQVTANVYASFKYMVGGASTDWMYWQKSILFGVQASSPEMYQVIISWISGALLPVVALGMTALVAQNLNLMNKENEESSKSDNKLEDDNNSNLITSGKYIDIEDSGIGGEPTIEEEKLISDFINNDKKTEEDILDEDVSNLIPEEKDAEEQYHEAKLKEQFEKDLIIPKKTKKKIKPIKKIEKNIKSKPSISKKEKAVSTTPKTKRIKVSTEKKEAKRLPEDAKESVIKDFINNTTKSEELTSESLLVPPELKTPYINNGVEVIDAKVVPTPPEVKKN